MPSVEDYAKEVTGFLQKQKADITATVVAASMPAADAAVLKPEVERIVRSLAVTKNIEEK